MMRYERMAQCLYYRWAASVADILRAGHSGLENSHTGREADRESDWASCMSEAAACRAMQSSVRTW
jgi:hypothetical protein